MTYHTYGIRHIVAMAALLLAMALNSCSSLIYDELEDCPRGVEMRFVFDYNLEFANAFPRQVDCLSVYLFDSNGNLVERRTETTGVLADEDWRMTFDLPAGDYQAVAYGGLECELASFAHTVEAAKVQSITDLQVLVNSEHVGPEQDRPLRPLHDLYHGIKTFSVSEGIAYDKTTIEMMRDTNHIRLVLQHLDYSPVDIDDFEFSIIDDNSLLDYKNDIVPSEAVRYTPWTTGTADAGVHGLPDDDDSSSRSVVTPVQVGYAEMSTSRLIHQSQHIWTDSKGRTNRGPRLLITTRDNGRIVADLPLNNYLLLVKSDYFAGMSAQEFLDRCARYNLVFFLDQNNAWVSTSIIVNDWVVRINDIDV